MSAAHEIPVEVADVLFSLECRVTFLKTACFAVGELPKGDFALADGKAWQGLYYWTQDLEDMIRKMNELANPA